MQNPFKRVRRRIRRVWNYRRIEQAVSNKRGLEIGGPSNVFSPAFPSIYIPPIYAIAAGIDNCNFAIDTTWSHGEPGRTFHYLPGAEPGLQYIHDATALSSIADDKYDFLLLSHVLEHVANPLAALAEFRRVLKPGGTILVLVPNRELTFDNRRSYTTFAHLQEDFTHGSGEDDLTHLDEILTLHDAVMHPVGSPAEFRERSLRNPQNRCMHHHVFSLPVLRQAFVHARLRPLYTTDVWDHHLLIFGRKS